MYTLIKDKMFDTVFAVKTSAGSQIPFDPANTDYQKFKADVLAGAELQDAEGNMMTKEEANNFIKELQ